MKIRNNHVFKTVAQGNDVHIILVHGLKDHYKPLMHACLDYLPLLRDKSTRPQLKGASLHIFGFTTETLFRRGKAELQSLADSLLRTSIERLYNDEPSQCFMFIGHGLACWIIQHALASRNPTTTSAKVDSICGVILWDPPERQEKSEWIKFAAPYIKTAREDAVSLQAQLIGTIEKNFELLEHHADSKVPAVKRIEKTSLTGYETKSIFSPMRRAQSLLYRRTRSVARESPEQMFPPVNESAIDLLALLVSEIYERRATRPRLQSESQAAEDISVLAKTTLIDAPRLQHEVGLAPFDQSKQSSPFSHSLNGVGAQENMSPHDLRFSLQVASPPQSRRHLNRSVSLCSYRNSNSSLSIRSPIALRRSLSLNLPRLGRSKSSTFSHMKSSQSSRWSFRRYISRSPRPPSSRASNPGFDLRSEEYSTNRSSLEQTPPTRHAIMIDDDIVQGASGEPLKEYSTYLRETFANEDIIKTVTTSMQLPEQLSELQESESALRELQFHARAYLSRGEYAHAGILYAQMSVLPYRRQSRRLGADTSDLSAEFEFEIEHQSAMRALRQGELDVARRTFEKLKEEHQRLKLSMAARWSLNHWLSTVYMELGMYDQVIILTDEIPKPIEPHANASESSYLDQLSEHQPEWLIYHAQALSCLARARISEVEQAYKQIEGLYTAYQKRVRDRVRRLCETRTELCDEEERWAQTEQFLRFRLTVVEVQILAGQRKAAKTIVDDDISKDCARILGKAHPLSIQRLVLKTQLVLPLATSQCDGAFLDLQDAMQHRYPRLHPLSLSVCELQVAISLRQGRLTEAMSAVKDLISRIDDAGMGKHHFRSLQARQWRIRVLFERGESLDALCKSEKLIRACENHGATSSMHLLAFTCVVDMALMHLRLRHYGTAEITLLKFFDGVQRSMLPDIPMSKYGVDRISDMTSKDIVAYLLELPENSESKTPVRRSLVVSYLTALHCLYNCYLERQALESETLDLLAMYIRDRHKHQSIGLGEELETTTLLYDLAITKREQQDYDESLAHLQEARKLFTYALGHDHPHTLTVDFESKLVKMLHQHSGQDSEYTERLSSIEHKATSSSGQIGAIADSGRGFDLLRPQKTILIRLDNALGGSHFVSVAARIDLANALWKCGYAQASEHLQLEMMWYLLPYKSTCFQDTPALPFTASETTLLSWSQDRARILREKLHHAFENLFSAVDTAAAPIDDRYLSAIASFAYDKHNSGYCVEAVTSKEAYLALCTVSGMSSHELAETTRELAYMRLELGYMHQSHADTCLDPTVRNQQYKHAIRIFKAILQMGEVIAIPLYNAARSLLGAVYYQQGRFSLAQDEQEKVYQSLKEAQTDAIYTLLDSIHNLALTEESLGKIDKALALWHEGKKLSSQGLGLYDEHIKLFEDKLRDEAAPRTRPSTATDSPKGNQRDSVIAASPKWNG